MANIFLKRGTSSNFNSLILKVGEPAFVTDLGKLYIGNGTEKILINPIDKPKLINTTNFFTKFKVNEYGQIVSQSQLTATDIPTIPSTQVTGLGTASTLNTGNNTGNIPVVEVNGKLNKTILPNYSNAEYAFAYFIGSNGTVVKQNQIVPLNTQTISNSSVFQFSAGTFTISETGIYIISYNITSSSLQMHTALSYENGGMWTGTMSRSVTTAVNPYITTCATIVKEIKEVPEKYGIRNIGNTDLILLNGYGSISIAKIK